MKLHRNKQCFSSHKIRWTTYNNQTKNSLEKLIYGLITKFLILQESGFKVNFKATRDIFALCIFFISVLWLNLCH